MITTSDLKAIARARLDDARVLLRGKRFDGAVYLSGYSVEVALKSRICRTLKWNGFPDTAAEFKGLQSIKTHDLEILLRLSGVEGRIKTKFLAEWSLVLGLGPREALSYCWPVYRAASEGHACCRDPAPGGLMISTKKLRKAMQDIAVKKGDFALFGLFMRAEAPGTWDLVVSAPWLEQGNLKALEEFTELLSKEIGEQSLRDFSRIVTLKPSDPAVAAVVSAFAVDNGELRVQRSNLFGLDIEDAIIMRAKKAA